MTRDLLGKPLSISQRVLFDALVAGECSLTELVDIYFAGAVPCYGPRNCVSTQVHYIRRKTGLSIPNRHGVYRIE